MKKEDFMKDQLKWNFNTVQKIYNSVFKGQVIVDDEMYVLPNDITITPYIDTEEDILGVEHEIVKWVVEQAFEVPGDYWTPPDVDIVEIEEFRNAGSAMVKAVEVLARDNATRMQEYIADEAYAAEEEKYRNTVDFRDF